MEQIILWIIYLLINLLWAYLNAILTSENIPTKHGWSAAGYGLLCTIILLHDSFSYLEKGLLIGSVILLHASVFPVLYNIYRKIPAFNLSTTTTSIIDRIQVRIGLKTSTLFNVGSFIISIILLILSIKK